MDEISAYCRQIETYLCRKNSGHLIRIVGPAFELVSGWAAQGVPLKIAFRGIDRFCERRESRGGSRRPVRIEFCEADILELFGDWRRAVAMTGGVADPPATPRKPSLAAHIERTVARLIAVRATNGRALPPASAIDEVVGELDSLAAQAKGARGERRTAIVDRLAALDRDLLDTAVRALDERTSSALHQEAEAEMASFLSRMPEDARPGALAGAFRRLVREASGLPTIAFE